jgi:hypothetical protein
MQLYITTLIRFMLQPPLPLLTQQKNLQNTGPTPITLPGDMAQGGTDRKGERNPQLHFTESSLFIGVVLSVIIGCKST